MTAEERVELDDRADWRAWLDSNHERAAGVLMREAGRRAVEEAKDAGRWPAAG